MSAAVPDRPPTPTRTRIRPRTRSRTRSLAWVLAVAVVLVQITYPLLSGDALTTSTIATVLLFTAASLACAIATHGSRAAVVLAVVAGGTGLAAEAVGVATGVPFGSYGYTGSLGPQVADVPVVVPLAWTMMAWPTLLAGRGLAAALTVRSRALAGTGRWLPVPLAAWALAAWDLYLDPQMVAAGHWVWADPAPALPGVDGIPLSNFAGWLLVALVMQALLHALVPERRGPRAGGGAAGDRATSGTAAAGDGGGPAALLLGWTWLGSGTANLVFFGRPAVGLWGLAAMGLVVGPWLVVAWRARSLAGAGAPALPRREPARDAA